MAKKRKSLYENYKLRYMNDNFAHKEMLSETQFKIIVDLQKESLKGKDLEAFKRNPARAIVMAQRQVSSKQAELLSKIIRESIPDSSIAQTPYLKKEIEKRGDFFAKNLILTLEKSLGYSYTEIIDSP